MNLSGGCYPALLVEVFACCHTELVEVGLSNCRFSCHTARLP